jgi:aminomethyltransferase
MPGDEPLTTPLHAWHAAHGARLVPFAGWSMPVQYTAIIEEHQAVRNAAGLFDISHMGRLTIHGPAALDWLEAVTTNRVARQVPGQVQYNLMATEDGGILDDILIDRSPFSYNVICNASNRAAVLEQLERHRPSGEAILADRTRDTAMIAVQGPRALEVVAPLFSGPLDGLGYYRSTMGRVAGAEAVVSRTGYTGEDGFEVIVGAAKAIAVWEALLASGQSLGIRPCGLGARDTLRFEAAMPLYGHELSREIDPFEAGLGWAVKLEKGPFVGREALRRRKQKPARRRVGLALGGKRIAREGYLVLRDGRPIGAVTSGTFAPTLGRSLAMALVEADAAAIGTTLAVDVRGTAEPAEVIPLPFYRRTDRAAATRAENAP